MAGELHVYAQGDWYDPAYIVGTREGLEILRSALNTVLERTGAAESDRVYTNAGQGYKVLVRLVSESDMDGYVLPYTDDIAQRSESENNPHWPRKRVI